MILTLTPIKVPERCIAIRWLPSLACSFIASCFLLIPPLEMSATAIYSYEGSVFTNISDSSFVPGSFSSNMRIRGTFTLEDLLLPLSDSLDLRDILLSVEFSNGRRTFSTAESATSFQVTTDADGSISRWFIAFSEGGDPFTHVGDEEATLATAVIGSGIYIDSSSVRACAEFVEDSGGSFCAVTLTDFAEARAPGTWTMVPEPAGFVLLALGLAVLAIRR